MKTINPPSMAKPVGHYSAATVHNGLVFVAGQLPSDMEGNLIIGTVEEQTLLCLERIRTILEAANSDIYCILKVNIFVDDIENWSRVNAAYAAFFGDHRPARVMVPTGKLKAGCLVEIDCIAAVKS